MNHGLAERDINTIISILERYPEVKCVKIFGSRAKGNFHTGSDVDLAIMNEGATDETVRHILSDMEDSALPYFVDVINYPSLEHPELRAHIDRVGIFLYEKTTAGLLSEPGEDYPSESGEKPA